MRVEPAFNLCRLLHRVFPIVAPREAVAPGRCHTTVCDTNKAAEAPRFAYWAYLERQNQMEANIDPGLPRGQGMFTPVQPSPSVYASAACTPCRSKPSVGLGGPSLGYVPSVRADQAPPDRAPHRTTRVYDLGVHGTAMDIIA